MQTRAKSHFVHDKTLSDNGCFKTNQPINQLTNNRLTTPRPRRDKPHEISLPERQNYLVDGQ